jgi:hypothetical protein
MSLRDRQIREVLDEDLRAYREVLNREFQQARLMNESYAPPNRLEKAVAFEIDKYFIALRKQVDDVVNGDIDMFKGGITNIITTYQQLVAYLDRYIEKNPLSQRDIAVIEDKFDALAMPIDQIATRALTTVGSKSEKRLAEEITILSNLLNDRNYVALGRGEYDLPVRDRMLQDRNAFDYGDVNFDPAIEQRRDPITDEDILMGTELTPEMEQIRREEQQRRFEAERSETPFDYPDAEEVEEEPRGRTMTAIPARLREFETPSPARLREVEQRGRTMTPAPAVIRSREKSEEDEGIARFTAPPIRKGWDRGETIPEFRNLKEGKKYLTERFGSKGVEKILREMGGNYLDKAKASQERLRTEGKQRRSIIEALSVADMNDVYKAVQYSLTSREMARTQEIDPSVARERPIQQGSVLASRYTEANPPQQIFQPLRQAESDLQGEGQRHRHRKHCRFAIMHGGFGETEGEMGGLPAGIKRGLELRPMDRDRSHRPFIINQDDSLTLERRMMFLNQLDTLPVKDEMEINDIRSIRKAMEAKLKKHK